jgi:hypothetical protein
MYLHDFIFHYNSYTKKWNAAKRDHYNELFSGNEGNVISSSDIKTLLSLINKYKGNVKEIYANVK